MLVTAYPREGTPSLALERVLVRAMSIEMVRTGLEPLPVLSQEEGGLSPYPAGASQEELVRRAAARGADFVLAAAYAVRGREAVISFRFYDVDARTLLAEEETAGQIDLSLDTAVLAAVEALSPRVAQRVGTVARAKAAEAQARRAAQAEEQARQAAEGEARESGEDPSLAFDQTAPEALPAQPPLVPPREKERFRRVELFLGFAPFIPVGAPDQYFTLGYAPTLGFLYRFTPGFGILGVGVHAGTMYLDSVDQDQAAYFRWLIPVGVDLRYILPEGRSFQLYAHLAGGAAYRLPDNLNDPSGVSERLTSVIPYARGGIGMLVGIGEVFALAVDAQYHAYFYLYRDGGGGITSEVISGILPSVSLCFRL